MHAAWAIEIQRRAAAYWTDARTAELARGKTLALLPGEAAPLLRAIGLLNADASMPRDRARKFFQINHMIAVLGPSLRELMATTSHLRLVDAACGRSYLTLALAWCMRHRFRHSVELVGFDRDPSLIEECRRRAAMTGLDDLLRFEVGTLGEVGPAELDGWFAARTASDPSAHGLVALHACDVATDHALALGVRAGCTLLATAPCCQAELARGWAELAHRGSTDRGPALRPGEPAGGAFASLHRTPHLRREAAATMTDAMRSLLLRAAGYEVWPLEFVPSEHTPKNTLLRAMYRGAPDPTARAEYAALRDALGGVGIRLEHELTELPCRSEPGLGS